MRQGKKGSRIGKAVLAAVLSLAMAIPAVPAAFSAPAEAAASVLYYGDVDKGGAVDANDALAILKHVVKIQPITDETALILADIDKNQKIDASDALEVLKVVVKLSKTEEYKPAATPTPKPTKAPATPTPEPTVKPTLTPSMTKPPVVWTAADEVKGEPVQIADTAGAQYDEASGVYTFLDEKFGMTAINPFAGHSELSEKPAELLQKALDDYKANPGASDKELVWALPGAYIKDAPANYDFQNADRRVTFCYADKVGKTDKDGYTVEQAVDYVIPKYTKGISISFWAKSVDEDGNDTAPAIVFSGESFMTVIRMNGSVQFAHATEAENYLKLNNSSAGKPNEWTYYTVTIANDWITIYINGEEHVYKSLDLSRKNISLFNDGFLTRYNSVGDIYEEDIEKDWRGYYVKSGNWYWNDTIEKWTCHDNYSAFGNSRFRGAGTGGDLLMDLLTAEDCELYIGGGDTPVEPQLTAHRMKYGTQVAGITSYLCELTPEQVAANYAAAKKPADVAIQTPAPTVEPTPEPTKNPQATAEPTPEPTATVDPMLPVEGKAVSIADANTVKQNGKGTFTQDAATGIITFNERQAYANKYYGVVYDNPMAGMERYSKLKVEDALVGQTMFPSDYLDENGKKVDVVGGEHLASQSWRGNYYDVYYGPVTQYGNQDPKTGEYGDETTSKIDIKDTSLQVTTYERPVWDAGMGASYSFWFKPTSDMDMSCAILSMYKAGRYMFYMDAKGTVFYTSLVPKEWFKEEVFVSNNSRTWNSFVATVKPEDTLAKAGQWNYYTVTFANDMITVYINGQEQIYSKMNLNRGDMKYLNAGYLTRYNTIGICMEEPDPVRKYATKMNYVQDAPRTYTDFNPGPGGKKNEDIDSIAIRANGVYDRDCSSTGKPMSGANSGGTLLTTFLSEGGANRIALGGYATFLQDNTSIHKVMVTNPETGLEEEGWDGWNMNTFSGYQFTTEHKIPAGAQAYDLRFYDCELVDTQVKANYEQALKNAPK